MAVSDLIPSQDATLGLIYRLNLLWVKTDYAVLAAKYNEWDVLLDRIYANLLYREDMEVIETTDNITGEKEIKSIELSSKDKKIYIFLSKKISEAKFKFNHATSPMQKSITRSNWYHALQKKDIWLRKLMYKHNLYLKEQAKTPGSALFGNFGKGK
ncbi:MAG: hypothetical protein WC346_04420 [Methanogenium sp.]|jgi:hypothetical protein